MDATILRKRALKLLDARAAAAQSVTKNGNPAERPEADAEPLIYGVGDVHGMNDLLSHLLSEIEADSAIWGQPATVVFLG